MASNNAPSSYKVVTTSFIVSALDITLNLVAAIMTGSVIVFSQVLQGMSDFITAGVLLLGVKRAARPDDNKHPFGYGREVFFWVLIASLIMFIGTGALSVYIGWRRFIYPMPINNQIIAVIVLITGVISNGYAFKQSLDRLHHTSGKVRWWRYFMQPSLIEIKATFIIDFLGTLAAVFGLIALLGFTLTGNLQFDGLGAISIGLAMMVGAVFLMREVKDLIVGRTVSQKLAQIICSSALQINGVKAILDLRTMYIGSAKLLVIIEVHLNDDLDTDSIEQIIDKIKAQIRSTVPMVYRVQVEVETPDDELA